MDETEMTKLHAQIAMLQAYLARAIKLGRAAYMHSYHSIDDSQACLDELAVLERVLPKL